MNSKPLIIMSLVVIVMLASGCVMYDSLYKYADNGTVSHPYGISFNYPSDWNLGEIESPFIMSLYEGEAAVPSIFINLANRNSERLGYIHNAEDLEKLLATMESEYSNLEGVRTEIIGDKTWVIQQASDKTDGKISYDFATLCPNHIFDISLFTNSTEGDPSILYPIAESLEC